jgi:hypothetical protein
LIFGGDGEVGIIESFGEGGMVGFSNWVTWEAYRANLVSATPDASPSSSSIIVGGLLAIFLICSAVAYNFFSISFSASFYCSFIQDMRHTFSFW